MKGSTFWGILSEMTVTVRFAPVLRLHVGLLKQINQMQNKLSDL